jgi:hypothetical protein
MEHGAKTKKMKGWLGAIRLMLQNDALLMKNLQ